MQVTVDIPDQFAKDLVVAGEPMERALLELAVAEAFRSGRLVTAEQVRVLLGFGTRTQAIEFLGRHEISIYTEDDFKQDLSTMAKQLSRRRGRSAA